MGWLKALRGSQPKEAVAPAEGEVISPPSPDNLEEEEEAVFGDKETNEAFEGKLAAEREAANMGQEWTMKVSPEKYLKTWPNGPEAQLALRITKGIPDVEGGRIRFFSPQSRGLQIVVESVKWHTLQTPGGSHTTQTEGIRVEFDNGYYESNNPTIIDYLTNEYRDKRFPVVRTDMQTASAHTY